MEINELVLFNGIGISDCMKMLNCLSPTVKTYKGGELIYNFGKNTGKIGIIKSGKASLVRIDINGNRTILESLNNNSIFGETFAFSGITSDSISAIANEDCEVFFVDYSQVTQRCSSVCLCHTQMIENLFSLISTKALYYSERIEVLSQRSIRNKLLCYFSISSTKANGNKFVIDYTLSDLADYICVNRSAMVRELKNMKDDGLIDMKGRLITLF